MGIWKREAPRLRDAGGADRAHRASAGGRGRRHGGGRGRRHGRGTQAEATAVKAQHPFTVAWVREAIEGLGGRYNVPPERELECIAGRLKAKSYLYTWKDQTSASAARASEVRNAL